MTLFLARLALRAALHLTNRAIKPILLVFFLCCFVALVLLRSEAIECTLLYTSRSEQIMRPTKLVISVSLK